jgi:hypothetical protein
VKNKDLTYVSIPGCHPLDPRLQSAQTGWADAANGKPLYGQYYNSLRDEAFQQTYKLFWMAAREYEIALGRKPTPWPRGMVIPLDVYAWHTVRYDLAKNPKFGPEFKKRRDKSAKVCKDNWAAMERERAKV